MLIRVGGRRVVSSARATQRRRVHDGAMSCTAVCDVSCPAACPPTPHPPPPPPTHPTLPSSPCAPLLRQDKETGALVTFCTGVRAGDTLMPMWCGTDYDNEKSRSCSSYFNMLYEVCSGGGSGGGGGAVERGSCGRGCKGRDRRSCGGLQAGSANRKRVGCAAPCAPPAMCSGPAPPPRCAAAVRQNWDRRPHNQLDRPGRFAALCQDRHRVYWLPRQVCGWLLLLPAVLCCCWCCLLPQLQLAPAVAVPAAAQAQLAPPPPARPAASESAAAAACRRRSDLPLRFTFHLPLPAPAAASTSGARTACRRRCTPR